MFYISLNVSLITYSSVTFFFLMYVRLHGFFRSHFDIYTLSSVMVFWKLIELSHFHTLTLMSFNNVLTENKPVFDIHYSLFSCCVSFIVQFYTFSSSQFLKFILLFCFFFYLFFVSWALRVIHKWNASQLYIM